MKNIYFIFIGLIAGLLISNYTIEASSNSNYKPILENYTNIEKSYQFSLHDSNVKIIYEKLSNNLNINNTDYLVDQLYSCYELTNKVGNDLTRSYILEDSYFNEINEFYNKKCK
tara:strand:+ start:43 stop:384 length:342 start_codon:yes stop_codon:yes gene_type:complete